MMATDVVIESPFPMFVTAANHMYHTLNKILSKDDTSENGDSVLKNQIKEELNKLHGDISISYLVKFNRYLNFAHMLGLTVKFEVVVDKQGGEQILGLNYIDKVNR